MVRDRRLYIADEANWRPYKESDFVLLSIAASEIRGDESSLPFYTFKNEALEALAEGKEVVKRGKAHLITAYQQMRKSDDVTPHEAALLFERWVKEFETEMERFEKL